MVSDQTQGIKSTSFYLQWIEWGLILFGLVTLTITESYQPYVTLGVLSLLISVGLRSLRTKMIIQPTGLELPFLFFLSSALVASWLAYDHNTSYLQFARILSIPILFYALCASNMTVMRWVSNGLVFLAAILAIYWPIQHDFIFEPAKFQTIQSLGLWINQNFPRVIYTELTGPSIHSNVAAGVLALCIPFGIAMIFISWTSKHRFATLAFVLIIILIVFGLILTSSRGAWMSVIVVGVLACLVWLQRTLFPSPKGQLIFWTLVILTGTLLLLATVLTGNLDRVLGYIPGPTGTLRSRSVLWHEGLGLVRDYFFTGSGLMTFWLVHPIYAMLIQVPFLAHVHNTYLEIWIEQGIFGELAIVIGALVVIRWFWRALSQRDTYLLGWAGIAAVAIVAIHGLVDVIFYVERTLPLIGVVLGFSWWASNTYPSIKKKVSLSSRFTFAIYLVAIGMVSIILSFFYKPILSLLYSNLAAIQQTRIELTQYDPKHFDNPTLDQVRQASDLQPVKTSFLRALSFNKTNLTSLQRMTDISMSLADYDLALSFIQSAWNAGYDDNVTRLLRGDVLVAHFDPDTAANIVTGLTWAEGRLWYQAYYRYARNNDYPRSISAYQAVYLINPQNPQAADILEEAQRQMSP